MEVKTELVLIDGSEPAPALAFADDLDTGIYRDGADSMLLVANGTERLAVTALGIGIEGALSVVGTTLIEGNTTIDGDLSATGEVTLGSADTDEHAINGDLDISSTLDVAGAATFAGEVVFSDTVYATPPTGSGSEAIRFNHSYKINVDNVGSGSNNTRWWLDGPDQGEMVLGPRSGSADMHRMRLRALETRLEGDAWVFGALEVDDGIDVEGGMTLQGGATLQGRVELGGSNLDGTDLSFLENTSRVLVGWNRGAGAGEIDFIANRGAGSGGGFRFYDLSNSGTLTEMLRMTPSTVRIQADNFVIPVV